MWYNCPAECRLTVSCPESMLYYCLLFHSMSYYRLYSMSYYCPSPPSVCPTVFLVTVHPTLHYAVLLHTLQVARRDLPSYTPRRRKDGSDRAQRIMIVRFI